MRIVAVAIRGRQTGCVRLHGVGGTGASPRSRAAPSSISHRDNPPSASIHEEATISVNQPFMAVFNNLVMFDPKEKINSPDKIVPDLAESWSWNPDQTKLTFKLRSGVKWHDGKPFSAKDVKCTWDALTGKADEKSDIVRKNPRKVWYSNLKDVADGRLRPPRSPSKLGRPQPSFLSMLAAGYSPVYACHVPTAATCAPSRSAPARSRWRSSSATNRSSWCAIPTTGRRAGPTSTPSTGRSCPTAARACWASPPASST